MGSRNACEEGGFSRIRVSDQTNVGDGAEFKVKQPRLPLLALGKFSGHPVLGAFKMHVPQSTFPPLAEHKLLTGLCEISN